MGLFFLPVKAEMLIFWILMTGGPPGDLQSVNLSLKMQILTEDVTTVHVKLHISSKTDLVLLSSDKYFHLLKAKSYTLEVPSQSPCHQVWNDSMSVFIGEKNNVMRFLDQFLRRYVIWYEHWLHLQLEFASSN